MAELTDALPDNVTFLLLRLAVLLIAVLLAEFEMVGWASISVPSTKRSLAASADTIWPSMETPAEAGCTVVPSRTISAGVTTNISPAIVMVANEGGAGREDDGKGGIVLATGTAISARPMSQAMSVMSIRREWNSMKSEEGQKEGSRRERVVQKGRKHIQQTSRDIVDAVPQDIR